MKHIKTFEDLSNDKPYYDCELFKPFIKLFYDCFEDDMNREGWTICQAPVDIPEHLYTSYYNRRGQFFQIQTDFDTRILDIDEEADEYARKYNLFIDEYGILLGYNNISFLEHPEKIDDVIKELEIYKNSKKYNL